MSIATIGGNMFSRYPKSMNCVHIDNTDLLSGQNNLENQVKIIRYPDKFNQQGVFIRHRQDPNSVVARTAFRVLYSIFQDVIPGTKGY